MNGYTLDTNVVTAYLKRNPLVRQRIRHAVAAGYPVTPNSVRRVCILPFPQLFHCPANALRDIHPRLITIQP
jgi:hypothetical protein